ncbi:MAG: hypothetical protein QG594_542 [Bacteroidota bacterium]|nr:hypothetical protein [Bacteroidota bacterium]
MFFLVFLSICGFLVSIEGLRRNIERASRQEELFKTTSVNFYYILKTKKSNQKSNIYWYSLVIITFLSVCYTLF